MNGVANIFSIFMVSAGTLAFEVVLTRVFALAYWHHFAGLLISLALTGFGTAGSLLAFLLPRLGFVRTPWLLGTALAGGLAMPLAYLAALGVGLEPLALAWSKGAWLDLGLVCLVLVVPFLLAAAHIGLVLAWSESPGRDYAANLAGSAAGCLVAAILLAHFPPNQAIYPAALMTCLGSAVYVKPSGMKGGLGWIALMAVCLGVAVTHPLPLYFEPFKDRSAVLAGRGNRLWDQLAGLDGLVEVIGGPAFHFAAGLSLNCRASMPPQAGLFLDGDLSGPVTHLDSGGDIPAFVDCLLARLPYRVFHPEKVLIVNPGGGPAILAALDGRDRNILAVENNPEIYRLMTGSLKEYSGNLYQRPGVNVVRSDPVSWLDGHDDWFDLIVLGDGGRWESGSASGMGVTRLLTVEGHSRLLERLRSGGALLISGPLMTPPRASVKLLATAVKSLESLDSPGPDPEECLALVRDWNTILLIVKPDGLTDVEIASLYTEARAANLDFSILPGLDPDERNRVHFLAGEPLARAAEWLFTHREQELFDRACFDLRPADRDRPYFFHFVKPKTLSLIFNPQGGRPLGAMEWGLLFTWGALGATLILAGIGIFLPLTGLRPVPKGAVFFSLIGMGYMLAEITLLGETIYRLGRPALSVPLVIGTFLLFSGLGSLIRGHRPPKRFTLASGVALFGALFALRYLPGGVWGVALALAPTAWLMGIPFAGGLTHLAGPDPHARAWAFGLNGFFSVAGSLAAGLICLQIGHLAGIASAGGCYLLAGMTIKGDKP